MGGLGEKVNRLAEKCRPGLMGVANGCLGTCRVARFAGRCLDEGRTQARHRVALGGLIADRPAMALANLSRCAGSLICFASK
jgi:hypothetical protein